MTYREHEQALRGTVNEVDMLRHRLAAKDARIAALETALREWVNLWDIAASKINGAIAIATLHGCPYTGPDFSSCLRQTQALLHTPPEKP